MKQDIRKLHQERKEKTQDKARTTILGVLDEKAETEALKEKKKSSGEVKTK